MTVVWNILWKIPVVTGALVIGTLAANQAGWSGAELIVNSPDTGVGNFITDILFTAGAAISIGAVLLVQRIAKPILWAMVPFLLYSAVVPGAWKGVVSDFDATRGSAIQYHRANAYALEHMTERGRFLSCQDERIELTEDAKAVCAHALNGDPGERIPGSEHSCGPFGMFSCFNTARGDKKSE
jgi:hypothetical protein